MEMTPLEALKLNGYKYVGARYMCPKSPIAEIYKNDRGIEMFLFTNSRGQLLASQNGDALEFINGIVNGGQAG